VGIELQAVGCALVRPPAHKRAALPAHDTCHHSWHLPPPACLRPADSEGRYSAALFVQWVPFELAGSSWEDEEERYVRHLLGLVDQFAPGEPA